MTRKITVVLVILAVTAFFGLYSCNSDKSPESDNLNLTAGPPPEPQPDPSQQPASAATPSLPAEGTPPLDEGKSPPADEQPATEGPAAQAQTWALSKIKISNYNEDGSAVRDSFEYSLNYDENGRIGSLTRIYTSPTYSRTIDLALAYNSNGKFERISARTQQYEFSYAPSGRIQNASLTSTAPPVYYKVQYEDYSRAPNSHIEKFMMGFDAGFGSVIWRPVESDINAVASFSTEGWPTSYFYRTPAGTISTVNSFLPDGKLTRTEINGTTLGIRNLGVHYEPSGRPLYYNVAENPPDASIWTAYRMEGVYEGDLLKKETLYKVIPGGYQIIRVDEFEYTNREPFYFAIPFILQFANLYGDSLLYIDKADIHFGKEGSILPEMLR